MVGHMLSKQGRAGRAASVGWRVAPLAQFPAGPSCGGPESTRPRSSRWLDAISDHGPGDAPEGPCPDGRRLRSRALCLSGCILRICGGHETLRMSLPTPTSPKGGRRGCVSQRPRRHPGLNPLLSCAECETSSCRPSPSFVSQRCFDRYGVRQTLIASIGACRHRLSMCGSVCFRRLSAACRLGLHMPPCLHSTNRVDASGAR